MVKNGNNPIVDIASVSGSLVTGIATINIFQCAKCFFLLRVGSLKLAPPVKESEKGPTRLLLLVLGSGWRPLKEVEYSRPHSVLSHPPEMGCFLQKETPISS